MFPALSCVTVFISCDTSNVPADIVCMYHNPHTDILPFPIKLEKVTNTAASLDHGTEYTWSLPLKYSTYSSVKSPATHCGPCGPVAPVEPTHAGPVAPVAHAPVAPVAPVAHPGDHGNHDGPVAHC